MSACESKRFVNKTLKTGDNMATPVGPNSKFRKLCNVTDKVGDYYILRKGEKNTRVISVADAATGGEGELVATGSITNEREVPKPVDPVAPTAAEAVAETPAA
jgi:hypothetical protein